MEPDFTDPLVIRATGTRRFQWPFFEAAVATGLTVIFFVTGGYAEYRERGGTMDGMGAARLLLLVWGVVLWHSFEAWRYVVRLDEQGVTLHHGFRRRLVRWDEAFIAQWLAQRSGSEDGEIHTSWKMEIRDAAGTVKMRVNGDMLSQHDRGVLECLVNAGLERQRILWLQREDDE